MTNRFSHCILVQNSLRRKPNINTNHTEWHIIVNQTLNMKDLEQRTFRSTFKDGLMDIFIGLLLIMISSNIYFAKASVSWGYIIPQLHIVSLGIYAAIVLFAFLTKRYIADPRAGIVRFGKARKLKLQDFKVFLWTYVVMGIVFGALYASGLLDQLWGDSSRFWTIVMVCFVFMSGFCFAANLTGVKRLYIYGILFALIFPLGLWFKHLGMKNLVYLYIFVCASVIIAIGSVLLARFIKEHPVATDEEQEYRNPEQHND